MSNEQQKKEDRREDIIDVGLEVVGNALEVVGDVVGGTLGAVAEGVGEVLSSIG